MLDVVELADAPDVGRQVLLLADAQRTLVLAYLQFVLSIFFEGCHDFSLLNDHILLTPFSFQGVLYVLIHYSSRLDLFSLDNASLISLPRHCSRRLQCSPRDIFAAAVSRDSLADLILSFILALFSPAVGFAP